MGSYTKMAPLSPAERAFAEDNHPFVLWYIRDHELDYDQYYDVAVMGYLKAVKNWFDRPDLHRYSFTTIARQCMRGYIGSEMQKEKRRLKTVSLEAIVRDTDGCTRMENITYANLKY